MHNFSFKERCSCTSFRYVAVSSSVSLKADFHSPISGARGNFCD